MKRLICFAALLALLAGCAVPGSVGPAQDAPLRIVATIFPEYDWTRALLGENPAGAELTLLLSGGVDMHSYQPTVEDIVSLSACDLFIYVGGESDAWVEDTLSGAVNPEMEVVNLMDVLGSAAKAEETVEGMQEDGEDEEGAYDEHVWLSLRNARVFCDAIAGALSRLDPDNAGLYEANAGSYAERLEALDREYARLAGQARLTSYRQCDVLLFADRFPFRYLTDDYGLTYYAAFPGCSAETEASFETVAFLAEKVDEYRLPAVLTTESPQPRLAETVVENTKRMRASVKILAMDSMQSTTLEQAENGRTYLGAMEDNFSVLQAAMH